MDYDPVKDRLGNLFSRSTLLYRLFFAIMNAVFLRTWHVRREIGRIMATFDSNGVRVLDAGTGFGQYAWHMVRRYPHAQVTAVDIKDDYLDRLRGLAEKAGVINRLHTSVDDLTRLETEGPFDLVLSVDVMEHIEDDRAVFANFERVLRPGGLVVVNTPSDLGGSDADASAGKGSFIGEHVREGYAREELEGKLRDVGLEVVRTRYTYGRAGSAGWRLLIKYPMVALSKSFLAVVLLPFYYLLAFPIGMLLNWIDVSGVNETGTGLLVTAQKPL